jgi:glycerophosphoryl diester phosphodiesterase
MKFIAHRGLMHGPNPVIENHPQQIQGALSQGFDCEIDVQLIDGAWWLGHDDAQYQVDEEFLLDPRLWLHAKNHEALPALCKLGVNCFWHQEDDMTLTLQGHLWTYPGRPLFARSIAVMPEWTMSLADASRLTCLGICSDHVAELRELRGR